MRSWLRKKRLEGGMSQQTVAGKIGVTQQYYNLIEKDERKKSLDAQLIKKLSDIFELSVEEIVELENR